jgi:hypothetical protein
MYSLPRGTPQEVALAGELGLIVMSGKDAGPFANYFPCVCWHVPEGLDTPENTIKRQMWWHRRIAAHVSQIGPPQYLTDTSGRLLQCWPVVWTDPHEICAILPLVEMLSSIAAMFYLLIRADRSPISAVVGILIIIAVWIALQASVGGESSVGSSVD